jgi:phospholipid/cholesterol/gamma-HCH transport system permease protein
MNGVVTPLIVTGRAALALLAMLGRLGQFSATLLGCLVTSRPFFAEVWAQSTRIGVQSVLIISAINFFVGANVALVGGASFKQFGGQDMVGIYVGLSCIVGMAPILVGAMLCAKPGTEIAATIASMRVKEQIDALEVMAINPYWYLIVPRFLAFLIVTPGLIVFAYLACVGGGAMAAIFQLGNNPGVFFSDVINYLTVQDLWNGIIRGEFFAAVTCLISCFFGYYSEPGPAGVSKAINYAVVAGSVSIIVLNYFLVEVMYK